MWMDASRATGNVSEERKRPPKSFRTPENEERVHVSVHTKQHGSVIKGSTITQLLRVTELVHTGFQNPYATGILFVDIAKAFDKIWHDGLVSKLMRLGFLD
ncbi:hypothetical protein TNCV_5065791 [Trichonephila clavipes]|nr:hypothetical protein TNCV_5065791 [Trichonephila clavipes]